MAGDVRGDPGLGALPRRCCAHSTAWSPIHPGRSRPRDGARSCSAAGSTRSDAGCTGRSRLARRSPGQPAAYDVAVHEVRKAVKRLRYAWEVAEPVIGADADRLAASARS